MSFLFLALLAGLGVALIAAPLGAFVVWQRLAYFGDTLAHASLLGIALGLVLSINVQIAIIFGCLMVAVILMLLQQQKMIPADTLLGIISHSALAIGLILVSLFDTSRLDLTSYLLGDILTTTPNDLISIAVVGVLTLFLVWRFWRELLSVTVNEALAQVEGIPVQKIRLLLMFLLAVTIAVAIKIVGVLLITALLIIPAATARCLSNTPEKMVVLSGSFGCLAVVGGLSLSLFGDTPAGPSIVASASVVFALVLVLKRKSLAL